MTFMVFEIYIYNFFFSFVIMWHVEELHLKSLYYHECVLCEFSLYHKTKDIFIMSANTHTYTLKRIIIPVDHHYSLDAFVVFFPLLSLYGVHGGCALIIKKVLFSSFFFTMSQMSKVHTPTTVYFPHEYIFFSLPQNVIDSGCIHYVGCWCFA